MTDPLFTVDDTRGITYLVISTPGEDAGLPSCSGNGAIVSAPIFMANVRGDGPSGDPIGSAVVDGEQIIIPGSVTADRSLQMLFMRVEYDTGGGGPLKVIIDVH